MPPKGAGASEPERETRKQAKSMPEPAPSREADPEAVNVAKALDALETNSSESVFRKGIGDVDDKEPKKG